MKLRPRPRPIRDQPNPRLKYYLYKPNNKKEIRKEKVKKKNKSKGNTRRKERIIAKWGVKMHYRKKAAVFTLYTQLAALPSPSFHQVKKPKPASSSKTCAKSWNPKFINFSFHLCYNSTTPFTWGLLFTPLFFFFTFLSFHFSPNLKSENYKKKEKKL